MNGPTVIKVEGVSQRFAPPGREPMLAVDNVSLAVREGEFVAVVGPSGCGKTTVLNMVAGLVEPTEGAVTIDGAPVTGIRNDVGYMFARDGLLPWRSALDNVAFGLELRGVPAGQRRERAGELLRMVGLAGFEHHLRAELSQGMRQRAALARTLATDPRIILMDEPFGALDAQTRLLLQDEFIRIWEAHRKTVVFVTHDLVEAILLADRVLVFSGRPGRIKAEFAVDLPRPRSATGGHDQRFETLRMAVWESLRSEVGGLHA
jgi:NitT/TauT family transport system ATP-binding protein